MRDFFFNDFRWKLFSLLLALAIWGTVHNILIGSSTLAAGGESRVTYSDLPVFIVASAADVHRHRVTPDTVKVTISGSPEAIAVLQANQIHATVDLTGIEASKETVRKVDVSVPAGITVLGVTPQKVGIIAPPTP